MCWDFAISVKDVHKGNGTGSIPDIWRAEGVHPAIMTLAKDL
jgi:hypothetical protein